MILLLLLLIDAVLSLCQLSNNQTLDAPDFVCSMLNDAKLREGAGKEIPETIKEFACPVLPPVSNGNVFCWNKNAAGTVCIGVCEHGWKLEPAKKKRCLKRKSWQNTSSGNLPVKWKPSKNYKCIREYFESPCLMNNGGCSHECVDDGSGVRRCICPCGYVLDQAKTNCERSPICSLDITVWLDGTSNSCVPKFHAKQKRIVLNIIDFFRDEIINQNGRIAVARYGNEQVMENLADFNSNSSVDILTGELSKLSKRCDTARIGNIFKYFEKDQVDNTTRISILSMLGEVDDSDIDILANRPKTMDNLIVIGQNTSTTAQYSLQTRLMACGYDNSSACDHVLMMENGILASNIQALSSRATCYDRMFSASIKCTEFHMEVDIPQCILRGLGQDDIQFNSDKCNSSASSSETSIYWKMKYNDCGIIRTVGADGIISYENTLHTKLATDRFVYPVLPVYNISLRCDQFTNIKFILDGDFTAKLTSITLNFEVNATITGNLKVFTDQNFSRLIDGNVGIDVPLYVESEVNTVGQVQLISCVTSPGLLDDLVSTQNQPVWPLLENGCLLDYTVQILPRGPQDQVRFQFQSFRFQNRGDDDVVNLQCKYRVCAGTATCGSLQPCTFG